jgi:arylsulfatase A-like enzyme
MWEYTFGLREYDDEELELTRATYDAAIAELDDHLRALIEALESRGDLADTVVILTSDHGEHLGEQHMLDHQHSIYQPLLRVPLIVRSPAFPAGREGRPVMSFDLFPTLLELTGVAAPPGLASHAVSLLHPETGRVRFAEEPSPSELGVRMVLERHPDWDPAPWLRRLRSLVVGGDKLIAASDGSRKLFDLALDPLELDDLEPQQPKLADSLQAALEDYSASLRSCTPAEPTDVPLTPEQRKLLESLGYVR